MKALFRWWRRRQRSIDLEVLWPVCKQEANSIRDARFAFFHHCAMDHAWTADYSDHEISNICERLT